MGKSIGDTVVITTGDQLNFLSNVTGTTGIGGDILVFHNTPTLVTPVLGIATATSINGLSLTSNSIGYTISGGTTSKSLTLDNTIILAGTDGSTLNISTGGTLGSNAFNSTVFLTTISGLSAGGDLSGTYPNPTLVNTSVTGQLITGYTSGAGTISSSDSILGAIQKLNGNIAALITGVSTFNTRSGAVTLTTADVNTVLPTSLGNVTVGSIPYSLLTGSVPTWNQSTSGNAATATALQTGRTINTVTFDGTTNITIPAAAGTLTGTTLNSTVVTSSLTSVGILASLTVTATITGSISGNAATATNGVVTTGSYSNPSWITGLAWSKISSTPTTVSGYGITDTLSQTLVGYTSGAGTVSSADSILSAFQKLNGNIGALVTGVSSVTGTSNRITSSGGSTPSIDISASYVGQTSITTLGTIATGSIPYSLITGKLTFGNGLNLSGTSVGWGGTLTSDGQIDLAGHLFSIGINGNGIQIDDTANTFFQFAGDVAGNQSYLSMAPQSIFINSTAVASRLEQQFALNQTDITLTDQINSKGIVNAGNYEANFTARSLTTVQYITSLSYLTTTLAASTYSVIAGSSSIVNIGTIATSPYHTAGVIHNSVTTGAFTSSLIVNADITNGTIAATKLIGTDITIAESQVTSLTTDLAAKSPLAGSSSITTVGTLSAGSIPYSLLTGTPSIPTGANPSASIGLTANNGSASTFMRSDATPVLGVGITPTWTGLHTFTGGIVQSGNISAAAWASNTASSVTSPVHYSAAATLTDTSTAGSTTLTYIGVDVMQQPTIAATNTSIVYTNAATLFIGNAPAAGTHVTITNPWAIYVAAGAVNFTGAATIGGHLTVEGVTSTGAQGTGKLVFDGSPTLTTPVLGVASATSINKLTLTAPATSATLTLANSSSLVTSGAFSITLTSTNTTSVTLPTSGTLVSSVTTGNGVSASNTAGALAFTLGAITPTTVNGNTISTGSGTLGLANSVTFTIKGIGQTTLVSGTKAISVTGVTTSSIAIVTLVAQGGTSTTVFAYKAVCTSGTVTITAETTGGVAVTTDTSILNYLVIN